VAGTRNEQPPRGSAPRLHVVVLVGGEEFLVSRAVEQITAAVLADEPHAAVTERPGSWPSCSRAHCSPRRRYARAVMADWPGNASAPPSSRPASPLINLAVTEAHKPSNGQSESVR
jgi:hypothetical protein